MIRKIATVITIVLITACNQHTVVESGQQTIDSFLVQTSNQWNLIPRQFSTAGLPTWTVDGGSLNSLTFISEIKDGETLFPNTDKKKFDTFNKDMLPTELVELVESTLLLSYNAKVTNKGQLKPIKIGGSQGFDFEFEFVGDDEITRKAYVAAAIKNEQLHLILFQATKIHYYDELIDSVKYIVNTATIKS